jgi:hypothetical protein
MMDAMGERRNPTGPENTGAHAQWLHLAVVAAIVALSIALAPRARDGAGRLLEASFAQLRSHATHGVNLRTPRAGELALTEPVLHTIELLRRNDVERYRLSSAVAREPFVRQRLIEGAWPIRFDASAELEIAYLGESTACTRIGRADFDPGWRIPRRQAPLFRAKRGVQLVRCD